MSLVLWCHLVCWRWKDFSLWSSICYRWCSVITETVDCSVLAFQEANNCFLLLHTHTLWCLIPVLLPLRGSSIWKMPSQPDQQLLSQGASSWNIYHSRSFSDWLRFPLPFHDVVGIVSPSQNCPTALDSSDLQNWCIVLAHGVIVNGCVVFLHCFTVLSFFFFF